MRRKYSTVYVTVQCPACPMCKVSDKLTVRREGYDKWRKGMIIQRALPELTLDEAELLKTGTHPACWDKLWGEQS